MKGSKICGISDLDTLKFIIDHQYPPQFIGFICNYKKSSRYVEVEKLNELLKLDKKKSNFVAVLVKPDEKIGRAHVRTPVTEKTRMPSSA